MRKITLLLAFIGMITLQSCTINEDRDAYVDNDTISEVLEVTTSFTGNSNNDFFRIVTIDPAIYASDMILVYHLYEVTNNGTDVWRLMPQTYFFENGAELDYNFDFTQYDVRIFLDANFDLGSLPSSWTQNQTFRIVIVPGFSGNKAAKTVDFKDYNATIKALKIDESKIKKVN